MRLILLCCSILSFFAASCQIEGRVLSATGEPIPGATLILRGSGQDQTFTDLAGCFKLLPSAVGDYILTVSAIGYETKEESINKSLSEPYRLDVILTESITQLAMVSVVADTESGLERKKGYAVASISVKELQAQSIEPNQILDQISGVKVRRQGGLGSQSSIYVNGLGNKAIRFFLDGIPMDYFGSSYSLNTIPISLINRIDVYKGIVPLKLNNDALGGAINIVTKKHVLNYAQASYSFGSFNTHRASFYGNYRNAKSGFTTKISTFYNFSDNDYKVWGKNILVTDPETFEIKRGLKVRRFHDAFESASMKADFGFTDRKWTDQFFVGLLLSGMDKEIQHGATMEIPFGEAIYHQQVVMPYFTYQKEHLFAEGLEFNVFASYSSLVRERVDTSRNIYNWKGQIDGVRTVGDEGELARTLNKMTEDVWMYRLNSSYALNERLSVGFNYLSVNITRHDEDPIINILRKSEGYFAPQHFQKKSFGLGLDGKLMGEKLHWSLFSKLFDFQADIRQSDYVEGVEIFEKTNSSASKVGWGTAGSYQVSTDFKFRGSFESAIRLPEAEEILGNGVLIRGNPSLRPESSDNINLGFESAFVLDAIGTFNFSGNVFYRMVSDLIQMRQDTSGNDGLFAHYNIGKVNMSGLDGSIKYAYKSWLQFDQSISWLNPIIKTKFDLLGNANRLFGTRLANLPFFQMSSSLRLSRRDDKNRNFFFYWTTQYVGAFYRSSGEVGRFGRDEIPAQLAHHTGAGYTVLHNRLSFSLDISNIFNKQLFDDYAIQKPGRGGAVKVTYQFSKQE